MNNYLDLIEALKEGKKVVCSTWNPQYYFELNKHGNFVSSKPNFSAEDEKTLVWKLYLDVASWEIWSPPNQPKVLRWKVYVKSPDGGMEIIWVTQEELFKIPGGTENYFVTEVVEEFPI